MVAVLLEFPSARVICIDHFLNARLASFLATPSAVGTASSVKDAIQLIVPADDKGRISGKFAGKQQPMPTTCRTIIHQRAVLNVVTTLGAVLTRRRQFQTTLYTIATHWCI